VPFCALLLQMTNGDDKTLSGASSLKHQIKHPTPHPPSNMLQREGGGILQAKNKRDTENTN